MNVRYSQRATKDLRAIHEYLIERSPKAAVNVLTAIYASIEFIRRYPAAAEATNIPDIRAKAVSRYRFKVFYRIVESDDAVEIVHIRHASRRVWTGEAH
jgi:plasmid stabilization system protein ParE